MVPDGGAAERAGAGRFERSFVVRMIRDFFVGVLFLTLLQTALDFALAL